MNLNNTIRVTLYPVLSALYCTNVYSTNITNGQVKIINSVVSDTFTNVGFGSEGTLIITNGGNFSTNYLSAGRSGGRGIVEVNNGGELNVNPSGNAYPFNIGGTYDGAAGITPAFGSLTITGAGSRVLYNPTNSFSTTALRVGARDGAGYITVLDGGKLFDNTIARAFGGIWIGDSPSGTGSTSGNVIVDGTGSELWSGSRIIVGTYSYGTLDISNGGIAHTANTIDIGNQASSSAYDNYIKVTGENSVAEAGTTFTVGLNGRGSAIVADSGLVKAAEIIIASGSTSSGEMAIGAREGENAVTAGLVDAPKITFGAGNGVLTFNHSSNDFSLASDISGKGAINAWSGVTSLSGDNFAFQGEISIYNPAKIVVSEPKNIGSGKINMADGTLAIETAFDWDFVNTLAGRGTLTVNTEGNAFNFNSSTLTDNFTGELILSDAIYSLADTNTAALSNVSLTMGSGSIVNVGEGQQSIDSLRFDGGTLNFGEILPGQITATNEVHTTEFLDISGRGAVQITTGGDFSNDTPTPITNIPLMEQDEENILLRLASGGSVTGNGGNLALIDQTGKIISNGVAYDITQNGSVVAKGTYDFRLTDGKSNDGLYVDYGLTQVELLGYGINALLLASEGRTGSSADLSARLFGSGDLNIDTGDGNTVSLSNLDNSYSGATIVSSGTLRMDNDNVLGNTTSLQLASGARLDMNSHSQTIGTLDAVGGSSLNLNNGELTITQGGTSDGALSGGGSLTLSAGTLKILNNNNELSATTTIKKDATAILNSATGLGIGDIVNAGILDLHSVSGVMANALSDKGSLIVQDNSDVRLSGNNTQFTGNIGVRDSSRLTVSQAEQLGSAEVSLNGTLAVDTETDWQLLNVVSGSGNLEKRGSGALTLTSAAAAYSGITDITAGGLILGTVDTPVSLQSGQINIASGAYLAGNGSTAGSVNNSGSLFVGSPASTTTLMARAASFSSANTFIVGRDLNNSGTVYVGNTGDMVGNELTVNGNYTGNNGALFFNTALADDNSLTDHMTVNGDTSGTTRVSVINVGGSGAETLNGIELIKINGVSNGVFTQEGRIVAGAYDYSLVRGNAQNSGNWYLTSRISEEPSIPGEDELRPEAGSYTANLAAANNMFIMRLHDRMGGTPYIDAQGDYQVSGLWMRHEGGHNRTRDTTSQLTTQSNRYIVHLGGDLVNWRDVEAGSLRIGIMGGYGNNKSHTRSSVTGYSSRGTVDGYTTGIYGTWFADENEKMGLYMDSWAQYSWFNNSVKGEGLTNEDYKSKGVTASVESGYTFLMGMNETKTKAFYLQPKAQITWMGVKADDHRESNGTKVSGKGNDNLQTRLGTRATLEGQNSMNQTFQLYTEANWLHNTEEYGVAMNGADIKQAGSKNIAELKIGIEGKLSESFNIWGNVGQQVGDKGYSDTGVILGLKYNF